MGRLGHEQHRRPRRPSPAGSSSAASPSSGTTAAGASHTGWRWTTLTRSSGSGCSTSSRPSISSSPWRRELRSSTGPGSVPAPLPPFAERVIAASAEYVVRDVLATWTARPEAITPEAADHYVEAFTAETITGMCADYRASFHIDRQMDAEDREAGRRMVSPVLVHWGAEERAMSDPLEVWRGWAERVEGGPLPSGHFIPEEAPAELTASLRGFLA